MAAPEQNTVAEDQKISERIRNFFRTHRETFFVGIASSIAAAIIVGFVIGTVSYESGRAAGFEAGRQDALSQFSDETVDIVIARNLKIDQALKEREGAFEDQLAEREAEFSQRLMQEETQFRAGLDVLVSERYAEALAAADQAGYERGESSGFQRGRSSGVQEAQLACVQQLEEITKFGRLWRTYVDIIERYVELSPTTEADIRSRARAIVDVAFQGRSAISGLSAQLNTLIDELASALQNDDIARVDETIRSLAETISFKGELWQLNYGIIVEFEQT